MKRDVVINRFLRTKDFVFAIVRFEKYFSFPIKADILTMGTFPFSRITKSITKLLEFKNISTLRTSWKSRGFVFLIT